MLRKFYVHYEGVPDDTMIVKWNGREGSVDVVRNMFVEFYNKRHGEILVGDLLVLKYESGKVLKADAVVNDVVKNGSDLYIVQNQPVDHNDIKVFDDVQYEKVEKIEKIKKEPVILSNPRFEEVFSDSEESQDDDVSGMTADEYKNAGNDCMKGKNYENAIEMYTKAIKLDQNNAIYYSNRAQALFETKNYEDTLRDANIAIDIDPEYIKSHYRKGLALMKLNRYDEAKDVLHRLLKFKNISRNETTSVKKLIKECDQYISLLPSTVLKQYYDKAQKEESAMKLNKARDVYEIIVEKNPSDRLALFRLGEIYNYAGKYQLALSHLKKAVQLYPTEIPIQETIGFTYYKLKLYEKSITHYSEALKLSEEAGGEVDNLKVKIARALYKGGNPSVAVDILMSLLKVNEDHFQGLFAYAKATKDHGTLGDAFGILLKLLVKDSDNQKVRKYFCYLLSLPNGYKELWQTINSVPPSALGFIASVAKDYGALEDSAKLYKKAAVDNNPSYTLNYVHVLEILDRYPQAFEVIKQYCKKNPTMALSSLTCADVYNVIRNVNLSEFNQDSDNVEPISVDNRPQEKPLNVKFEPEELDLLAIFCTLGKILYIKGRIDIFPFLADILNPIRKDRKIHETLIRNEHAYFACIDDLMVYHTTPLDISQPVIYFAGDSHSLATAWQTVTFKGEEHLIHPLLVTGLKCWHLRPKATFYPKSNFYHVVPKAPRGSTIVFMFGEIDCREGLIVSVQKCRYENYEEGIRIAIGFYIDTLLDLIDKYDYKIYIHPAAPVIDVTREIVILFNQVLKEIVNKTPQLQWLDFFYDLLTPDQKLLNPDFALDGTHMNPTYLPLVSEAFSKLE